MISKKAKSQQPMTAEAETVTARPAAVVKGGPYAIFVLAVLSFAGVISFIDRQIISLLVDPIKLDLRINDTQIGLLQGFSFALFYAVLALPLARLSDHGNRVQIITFGIICWSIATFFCGLATTFALLFIARMFVGVGEATLAPSGYSLVADYFTKERVGLAISIFTGANFVGTGLAYIAGGAIIEWLTAVGPQNFGLLGTLQPWQMVFVLISLPSIPLLVLMFFVREPPREEAVSGQTSAAQSSVKAVIAYLADNKRLFAGVFIGLTLMAAGTFAVNAWVPAFFIRVHQWSPLQIGSIFGLMVMLTSAGGVFGGGAVASTLMRRGVHGANLAVPMVAGIASVPFLIAFPLIPDPRLALVVLAPGLFFVAMPYGCGSAVLPLISPNRMRAQIVAIYLLIANLLGFTLGPTSIGVLTDYVFGDAAMIGHSLALAPAALIGIGLIVLSVALTPYRETIRGTATA